MTRKIRLAVVDDHPLIRRGISDIFKSSDGFEVVGEGGSADDAVGIAEDLRPDLMLLDISMPGDGVRAASRIREVRPEMRVAMLSIRDDLATVRASLQAGARGFISKGVTGDELVDCARKIAAGASYVSPELAARLLSVEPTVSGCANRDTTREASTHRPKLTEREDQIFRLLGEGLSNQEIAQRLGLTENTVKHYITPLLQKLGVRNRTEAALLATGAPVSRASDKA
jgi:two-component system, NarL family, nitrate/nitrite response regulator NarL